MSVASLAENIGRIAYEQRNRRQTKSLIDGLSLSVSRAFDRQAVLFIRELRVLQPMIDARASAIQEAADTVPWEGLWREVEAETLQAFLSPMTRAVASAMGVGWEGTAADIGIELAWDVKNPYAVQYLQTLEQARVPGINETTMRGLRKLLAQAADEGWAYGTTQRAIRDQFNGFSATSRLHHIRNRAELVAVTEIGDAYSEGTYQIGQSLQTAGLMMEKRWVTRGDDRVDPDHCRPNEEQGWIPFDEPFQSEHQRPLAHAGCRCVLQTRRRPDEQGV